MMLAPPARQLKGDLSSMEKESLQADLLPQRLAILATIARVPGERVTQISGMGAYLVGSTGLKFHCGVTSLLILFQALKA